MIEQTEISLHIKSNNDIDVFLANYTETVVGHVLLLQKIILKNLPGIIEQVDLPARMIAYSYGNKYIELICVLIPSKKGLKLGFNRGNELPDPAGLLKGKGKISRYVEIMSEIQIKSPEIKQLLSEALAAYKIRMAQ